MKRLILLVTLIPSVGCVSVYDSTEMPETSWDSPLMKNISIAGFKLPRRLATGSSVASFGDYFAAAVTYENTTEDLKYFFNLAMEREGVSRGEYNRNLPQDYRVVGRVESGHSFAGGNPGAVAYNLIVAFSLTPIFGVPITHSGWANVHATVYSPDGRRVGEAASRGHARAWGYVFLEGRLQSESEFTALHSALRSVAIQVGNLIDTEVNSNSQAIDPRNLSHAR